MKVTVFHNVSRDASFGLNMVFRTGQTSPKPGRTCYQSPESGLWGWKERAETEAERHELVRVFEYEADPDDVKNDNVLNRAYDAFQKVGGGHQAVEDPAYFGRKLRSLSVGDVLALDDGKTTEYWSVESCGFASRREEELRVLTAAQGAAVVRERYQFKPGEPLTTTVPLFGTVVGPNALVVSPEDVGAFLEQVNAEARVPLTDEELEAKRAEEAAADAAVAREEF